MSDLCLSPSPPAAAFVTPRVQQTLPHRDPLTPQRSGRTMDDEVEISPDSTIESLLPDKHIPLGFVGCIKALDEEGDVCFYNVRTTGVSSWEGIGMLTVFMDNMRDRMRGDSED